MLKIIKMISLFCMAITATEIALHTPPQSLHNLSVHQVMVTAYTTHPKCTASRRNVTSSCARIQTSDYGRLVALSSDLAKGHEFGDQFKLVISGKTYEVAYRDNMPKRHRQKVDLLLPSLQSCREFGRRTGVLIPLDKA